MVVDGPSSPSSGMVVTGYPVRAQLFEQDQAQCRAVFGLRDNVPVLIIYGGSRGARSINRAIERVLPDMLELAQIIHVCGREGDETWLRAAAEKLDMRLQERYRLYPYLESAGESGATVGHRGTPTMLAALGAADLAVCRSGASTIGELPALGLPAVLVPYPYVNQDENADYLVRHGAACKVTDADMVGEGDPRHAPLFTCVYRLLKTHTHERLQMVERSRALARPGAAQHLAETLQRLAARRG
jgi:UDP-N-acetylglucosamine--N-acetylmuramyl-(pentapeptide) pyrophosphoryl-undecaprenol N-acetylglucosamine transferase